MPKLIRNIEDRIFFSAKELFSEKGYEQVNMKEIAKRADMAVGTLYNYFSNKNELYFSVLEKSWNSTLMKLNALQKGDIDNKKRLKSSILFLYEDILERKCMGIEVRKVKELKDDTSFAKIEQKILNTIKAIFTEIKIKPNFEDDENILDKVVYSLLINVTLLVEYYNEDKINNLNYLYSSVIDFFELGVENKCGYL